MSNRAIDWAIGTPARGSAKAVLFVMANQARDKPRKSTTTGKLWPPLHVWMGHASIADQAGIDVKTVPAALAKLEALGLIARAGTDGGTGQVKVFELFVKDPESGGLSHDAKDPESGDLSDGSKDPESGGLDASQSERQRTPVLPSKDPVFSGKGPRFSHERTPKTGDVYPAHMEDHKEDHTRKRGGRAAQPASELLPEVDPQVLADWLKVRKAKRVGEVTPTVVKALRSEAMKAGLGIQAVIETCASRGWASFRAGWGEGQGAQRSSRPVLDADEIFAGAR